MHLKINPISLLTITVILLIFTSLMYEKVYFSDKVHLGFSFNKYLDNPQLYGGEKVEVFGTFNNVSDEFFYFNIGDKSIKVYGSHLTKPIFGETVLHLSFKKDGVIEMIDYHNYNLNYLLYVFSLIAVFILLILFFKEWKITPKGFKNA